MTGIERLRKLSDDLIAYRLWNVLDAGTEEDWDCHEGDYVTLSDVLEAISDQIEREMKALSEVEKMKCDPAGVSMSAYDLLPAAEDRDAAAWVREHGGLKLVTSTWENDCLLAERVIDELWNGDRPVECDNDDVMDELRRRLMPEGYEWPRYEGGPLLRYGDSYIGNDGDNHRAWQIRFDSNADVHVSRGGDGDGFDRTTWDHFNKGERVKRPAVPAADGEPLEVGQTLWDVDGYGPLVVTAVPSKGEQLVVLDNGGTNFYRYPEKLTHERPDSWERIEEDATLGVNSYRERYGIKKHDGMTWPQLVREDLVRRCRALAERERGE